MSSGDDRVTGAGTARSEYSAAVARRDAAAEAYLTALRETNTRARAIAESISRGARPTHEAIAHYLAARKREEDASRAQAAASDAWHRTRERLGLPDAR